MPKDLVNKSEKNKVVQSGADAAPQTDELEIAEVDESETEDDQLSEIQELQVAAAEAMWPSEFIRQVSAEFDDPSFMDEDYTGLGLNEVYLT
jgi:hypothetical protein